MLVPIAAGVDDCTLNFVFEVLKGLYGVFLGRVRRGDVELVNAGCGQCRWPLLASSKSKRSPIVDDRFK
jgi:hypothetical protein